VEFWRAGGLSRVLAVVCMCVSVWVWRVKILFCFVIVLQRLTDFCNVSSVYDARIACCITCVRYYLCYLIYLSYCIFLLSSLYIYNQDFFSNCLTVSFLIVPTRILGFGAWRPKHSMAYIGGVSPPVFISSALSLDY
jgi:hypothetical protein